ncbi:DUF1489 family protein [Jannaschia aquimarina]|uniref:Lysophospholipase n=1 Tax=Jannaschia aquimarina TaxID=935700 RepID=A0A0D1EE79_9RHOB|nr:DUF1489 domain-containing protein [Jannaschia aquimarina]KIT14210.1 hypothetical protein jaqu_40030 [Jannaschia aquimarina]SNS48232.1 hypothetical protein SAMN05421775_101123 [Jannaschia aquimarina]
MAVNLIKLSVGTTSIDGLAKWQRSARAKGPDGNPRHVTRMWPKREAELLEGGSIYWVIKGVVLCRQPILRLEEVRRQDGIPRCGIVLQPGLVPVAPTPKRAFQGWRYLTPDDAPADLDPARAAEAPLPPKLQVALAELGVL